MSQMCWELERRIRDEEAAFIAMHTFGRGYYVSEEAIGRIPASERRECRCDRFEKGLNIFQGLKSTGSASFTGFRLGNFLFSVSEKTAKEYLPKVAGMAHG